MRRPALLVLIAMLPTAAPAEAAPVCGPVKARTMAAGELTRVYVKRQTAFACTRGVPRARSLGSTYCYGSSSGCSVVATAAVAGRFAASAVQDGDNSYGDEYFRLTVRNVATGRITERRSEGDPGTVNAHISRIVLRPSGAAAWLWRREEFRPYRPAFVVSRSARCGAPTTLAAGADVWPHALWRDGSRVFWRQGDENRSAPLC